MVSGIVCPSIPRTVEEYYVKTVGEAPLGIFKGVLDEDLELVLGQELVLCSTIAERMSPLCVMVRSEVDPIKKPGEMLIEPTLRKINDTIPPCGDDMKLVGALKLAESGLSLGRWPNGAERRRVEKDLEAISHLLAGKTENLFPVSGVKVVEAPRATELLVIKTDKGGKGVREYVVDVDTDSHTMRILVPTSSANTDLRGPIGWNYEYEEQRRAVAPESEGKGR